MVWSGRKTDYALHNRKPGSGRYGTTVPPHPVGRDQHSPRQERRPMASPILWCRNCQGDAIKLEAAHEGRVVDLVPALETG